MIRFTTMLICLATAQGCVGEVPDGAGNGNGTGTGSGDGDGSGSGDGDGSGSGDGTGGGRISATQYLTQFGTKDCDQAFACKASFPTDAGVTFDEAFGTTANACYASAAAYFNAPAVEQQITAGKITYDGAAAKTCLAGMTTTACPTYWASGPSMPAACDGIFIGQVANGGACVVDFECSAADSVCDPTAQTCGPDAQGARHAPRDAGLPLHLSSALR